MGDLIREIPEGHKRGWTVTVNGQVIEDVKIVQITSQCGKLSYGLTPGNYDGWSFHEVGGGGAVTIPYSIMNEKLFVGVVWQDRPNQGGFVWNVPRGFIEPGETHFQAAVRETEEEVGYRPPEERVRYLPGLPTNPNSAFFETTGSNEGVHIYSLYIYPEELQKISGDDKIQPSSLLRNRYAYTFKEVYTPNTKLGELILGCEFQEWHEAIEVSDQFTVAAIGRLLKTQARVTF